MKFPIALACLFIAASVTCKNTIATEPLASWNDTPTKAAIVNFVRRVTEKDTPDFIPIDQRIATFDNDGTLWSEQPAYFQTFFIIDRIRSLASEHPEWETQEPFASAIKGDLKAVAAYGHQGLLELTMATHAGMTTEQFDQIVKDWIDLAKHPQTGLRLKDMVYQPMLEIIDYLNANGKPVAIHHHIGRRPVMAFGNSDGDLEMLQWTSDQVRPNLAVIIHHTDAERECAYDRQSAIGRLDKAMDVAKQKGWLVVDMKLDWNRIYPARQVGRVRSLD